MKLVGVVYSNKIQPATTSRISASSNWRPSVWAYIAWGCPSVQDQIVQPWDVEVRELAPVMRLLLRVII